MSGRQHGGHDQGLAPFQQSHSSSFQPVPSPCQPAPSQFQPSPSQRTAPNAETSPSNRAVRFTDHDSPPAPSKPKAESTKVAPARSPRDFLEEVCNEMPALLKLPESHSKSNKSRPPKFFDMHLHESLRLKNIVFLDNLPKALSDVFEEYLQKLDPSDRHCWVVPPTGKVPKSTIRNESDLADHYRYTSAPRHTDVASKLRFGKHPVFKWDVDPLIPDSMTRVVEAVGDAFTFVVPDAIKTLSGAEQENVRLLDKYGLMNFTVWELKSLKCGPKVMQEIPNLEGAFPWKACQERSRDDQVSSRCDSATKTHRTNGNLVETGRRTGPDSSVARNVINKATSTESPKVGSVRKERSLTIPERAAAKRRKPQAKRATTEPRPAQAAPSSGGSKKAPKLENEQLPKRTPVDDARDLMQQGWTEAVVEDATFIVFNAGNEEYIGIRDRESQTLYISRAINPSEQDDPIYGKIHVGLCIVAYDDAVDRVQTLSKGETPWRWDLNLDKQPVFAARPKPTREDDLTEAQKVLDANFLKSLRECQRIDIRYHLDGHVKKESRNAMHAAKPRNINTWRLKREVALESDPNALVPDDLSETPVDSGLPAMGSAQDMQDPTLEGFQHGPQGDDANLNDTPEAPHNSALPSLFLDQEHGCGKRVFHGYLGQTFAGSSKGKYFSEPLFIKLAPEDNRVTKNALIEEYRNYKRLREANAAVVEAYGLFSYKLRKTAKWYILILANGGGPLDEVPASAVVAHAKKYQTNYRKALETFHSQKWVHGLLDTSHMLLHPKTKEAKFISLSSCARHAGHGFSDAAQSDLNVVETFFDLEESQATASQAPSQTQESQEELKEDDDCGFDRAEQIDSHGSQVI